ncbi:hypothetical protein GCM10007425_30820 [Lysinibacillus alkalisoli]|uniref:Uncharacterized protein n=1 Tax=Lysinibacillus alkalisoli TaxID=1911548 RepID=A0A917GB48_9BACI|nr:hypothetical protein [Lysinibacillus alkalisoli]GGG33954.1 hypothetical protein GCM10007425_30820 [Lysinibacillus alkalisoli]
MRVTRTTERNQYGKSRMIQAGSQFIYRDLLQQQHEQSSRNKKNKQQSAQQQQNTNSVHLGIKRLQGEVRHNIVIKPNRKASIATYRNSI